MNTRWNPVRQVRGAMVLLTAAVLAPSIALPAPVFFTDRASFLAAAGGGLNSQSFEVAWTPAASVSFSGFTLSEINVAAGSQQVSQSNFGGAVTDGLQAAQISINGNGAGGFSQGQFVFGPAITAFGVDVSTSVSSTMTISGDVSFAFGAMTGQVPRFFGVIDTETPFTTIIFSAGAANTMGFDQVAFGAAAPTGDIPEPATGLAALVGVILVSGITRRRR